MVRLTDRPDMTLDVYRGRKTTMQQQQKNHTTELKIAIAASIINSQICEAVLYCRGTSRVILVLK